MATFISVMRRIAILKRPPPTIATAIAEVPMIGWGVVVMADKQSPYPPSFKRIPARIIDPATGAST